MSTLKVNTILPKSGTSVTLGESGKTITIPSGTTIANSGTATGFGVAGTESFLAYNSAGYDTSHNTSTLVQLASELYDTDNRFTNTASNYKYTVANAGKYFFFGNVQMSGASSETINQAFLNIYKNGSSIAQVGINYSGNYSDVTQLHITVSDDASANDYYQLYNYAVTSGGANMIIGGGNRGNTYFGGFRLA
jgi:hypothetical protein